MKMECLPELENHYKSKLMMAHIPVKKLIFHMTTLSLQKGRLPFGL